jgi:hypothetical protein
MELMMPPLSASHSIKTTQKVYPREKTWTAQAPKPQIATIDPALLAIGATSSSTIGPL